MKVFFDTNVYVAEVLLGETAELLLKATERASWRVFACQHLLDEVEQVVTEQLGFSRRLATLSCRRIMRRATCVASPPSRHSVPQDPKDSPILSAALEAGCDFLVTNDTHLLSLNPYEGLRIISMAEYYDMLVGSGLIP
jgi:putative PIN family toxin of toxin-antitoxin system